MLKYRFNIIEALKKAGYNSTRILKEGQISQRAMQSLRDGDMVGIFTIDKICELLHLQPGDIIEFETGDMREAKKQQKEKASKKEAEEANPS